MYQGRDYRALCAKCLFIDIISVTKIIKTRDTIIGLKIHILPYTIIIKR